MRFAFVAPVQIRANIVGSKNAGPASEPMSEQRGTKRKHIFAPARSVVESGHVGSNDVVPTVLYESKIRDFRFALARQAKRLKVYPPLAHQQGLEGVVELDVRIFLGKFSVKVHKSSGYDLLDHEAQQLLLKSISQLDYLPSVQGISAQFTLPIEFTLN